MTEARLCGPDNRLHCGNISRRREIERGRCQESERKRVLYPLTRASPVLVITNSHALEMSKGQTVVR